MIKRSIILSIDIDFRKPGSISYEPAAHTSESRLSNALLCMNRNL